MVTSALSNSRASVISLKEFAEPVRKLRFVQLVQFVRIVRSFGLLCLSACYMILKELDGCESQSAFIGTFGSFDRIRIPRSA